MNDGQADPVVAHVRRGIGVGAHARAGAEVVRRVHAAPAPRRAIQGRRQPVDGRRDGILAKSPANAKFPGVRRGEVV